ncbi:MAG: bifunctional histidinol-phosphatase/imidazoleglycerol-phosphate dehydratase HisB [Chromatiales bacterium]|nr:bifunctional histidinol-phosphatase/imidazoleglycerol-phosphate dehydratase HisB [Chromatiales bacterium]
MAEQRVLFVDRDGTMVHEPPDEQVDALDKIRLLEGVIPALARLSEAGYRLVLVSNQDGLGTQSFPQEDFDTSHDFILGLFASQGVHFDQQFICPHFDHQECACRKPRLGLLSDFLREITLDRRHSYVIGDRETDMQMAANLGIQGLKVGPEGMTWKALADQLLLAPRIASRQRKTRETDIKVELNLDVPNQIAVDTGIGFFDHMLEQLAKHGGFSLSLSCKGDLQIDEHHTVEDCGIALGEAMAEALGSKHGIGRYGFLLPMDESQARVALDLGGRSYLVFEGDFPRDQVGGLSTEMVSHFFRSLSQAMACSLHIHVEGENTHHMVEAVFKAVGRATRQAIAVSGSDLPTTKGIL